MAADPEAFGRYFLLERIAAGGMAEVFAAQVFGHGGFEQTVAVKRIRSEFSTDPTFTELFVDEARTTVALQHPNVVRILDFERVGPHLVLAMELVPGRDLAAVLRAASASGVRMPPEFVAYVGLQACHGLHYAHTRLDAQGAPLGIVHRDVSPGNLLLSLDGHVKVADFGIARAAGSAASKLDDHGAGKVPYMPPEQRSGGGVDARSDVWALAAVLYEALTGRRAFPGDDPTVLPDITALVPPRALAPATPRALQEVLLQALDPVPTRRFASARTFGEALRRAGLADTSEDAVRESLAGWLADLLADDLEATRVTREAALARARVLHEEAAAAREGAVRHAVRTARTQGALLVALLGVVLLLGAVGWLASLDTAPPVVTVAGTGRLAVGVTPAATLFLDGRPQGQGAEVEVASLVPGVHAVRLEAEGYTPHATSVAVARGGTTRIDVALERAPEIDPFSLSVTSRPAGATVVVDGKVRGTTPWRGTLAADPPHRVVLKLDGFADADRLLRDVAPGDRRSVSVTLRPPGARTAANDPGELAVRLVGATWAHVWVDGRKLASTAPLTGVSLDVGSHEIRVVNEAAGVDTTQRVEVGSGERVTVRARAR